MVRGLIMLMLLAEVQLSAYASDGTKKRSLTRQEKIQCLLDQDVVSPNMIKRISGDDENFNEVVANEGTSDRLIIEGGDRRPDPLRRKAFVEKPEKDKKKGWWCCLNSKTED